MSPLPPQLPEQLCSLIDVLALEPPCADPLARLAELFEGRSLDSCVDVLATGLVGLLEELGPPGAPPSALELDFLIEHALFVTWGVVDRATCRFAVSLCRSAQEGPRADPPTGLLFVDELAADPSASGFDEPDQLDPVLTMGMVAVALSTRAAELDHSTRPGDPLREVFSRSAIGTDILARLDDFPEGVIDLPPSSWQPSTAPDDEDPFDPFDDPLLGS